MTYKVGEIIWQSGEERVEKTASRRFSAFVGRVWLGEYSTPGAAKTALRLRHRTGSTMGADNG